MTACPPVPPPAAPDITDAQLALGQMCLDQGGDARKQAVDWFRSAALGGDARAINMLGRCHENGWGVPADSARAAAHYRKAADLGDAWGMFNLADLHYRGLGVGQDDGLAFDLYAQAAAKGHAKALNMIGLMLEAGRGVGQDREQARACYLAAAHGGDCWGCFNHARGLLDDGAVAAALPWLDRAIQTGFPLFFQAMGHALSTHPDHRVRSCAMRAITLSQSSGGGS